MAPKLFLSYDSNSGPGQFGLGWSLAGVSSISRINRTTFIDGRPAAIEFDDATDALALDGARLVAAPEGGIYLAKAIDDQTRVWRDGQKLVAKTKAGLTLHFGESANSRIATAGGKVLTWALSRIEDTFGNQVVFLYAQRDGDWGIDKVFWTIPKGALDPSKLYDESSLRANSFASVQVIYEAGAATYSTGFVGGERTSRSLAAKQILALVGQTEFRRYEFEYDVTGRFGGRRLTSIREVGADVGGPRIEYPKTVFTHTGFDPQWSKSTGYELPSDFGSYRSLKSGYRMVDLDGDGDRDVLYSAYIDGHSFRRAFKQDAQQWVPSGGLVPPIDFSTDTDETDPVFFFDSDGDKKPELYSSRLSTGTLEATAHVQDNDTWKEIPARAPPFLVVMDGQRLLRTFPTTWESQSRLLTWDLNGALRAWVINQDQWTSVVVAGWPEQHMPAEAFDGDFDCDGKGDLATLSSDRKTLRFFRKGVNTNGDIELQGIATTQAQGDINIARQITRSGCSSVAMSVPSAPAVFVVGVDSSGTIINRPVPATSGQMGQLSDLLALDLDGQGQQDIALLLDAPASNPNVAVFRFDPLANVWAHEAAFDYIPASSEAAVDAAYLVAVEDVDDDKRDDLLLLPAGNGVTTKALLNTSSSFKLILGFAPPIEFAREEKVGASPQFVDLNADGLTDVAGNHVDKDGKEVINTAQINTKSGWIPVDALKLPKPITHEKGGSAGAFVDFNSDGIADFVYAYGDAKEWGAWKVEFDGVGNAIKWVAVPGYTLPPEARLSDPENGDMGVRFMDLNADARVDILVARRELDGSFFQRAFLNTSAGWVGAPAAFLSPVPFVSRNAAEVHYETKMSQGEYYRDLQVSTYDINGDGLADLLFRYGHNQATNLTQNPLPNILYEPGKSWCLNRDKFVPGPMPGDPGTIELHPIPSITQCAGVYLATGLGWREGPDSYLPPVKIDLSIEEENASIDFSDVNGDGLVDLVPSRLMGSGNAYPAYLNTGKSWVAEAAYAIPPDALSADKKLSSHRIMDLNGDGLVDVAFHRPGPTKGTFLNTGTGWSKASDTFAPPEAFINDKGEDQGVRFIDVDGNGMPDALRSFRDKTGNLLQSAYLNSGDPNEPEQAVESRADMLKTVANGMGLVTTLSYKSLITPRVSSDISPEDFYTPSPISPFPTTSHVPTMYAVQEMAFTDTDGSQIGTRYQYKGFRFDVPAAAVLGFEERNATNFVNGVASGISERVELFQDYFRVGRSKRELAIVDGLTVSEAANSYDLVEQAPTSWPKRLVLSSTTSTTHDLNGDATATTKQSFVYDAFNNATETCVEYGDGSRKQTINTYDNAPDLVAPSVLFLGRLIRTDVSHYRTKTPLACNDLVLGVSGVPPDEIVTNTATFAYDIRRDEAGKFDLASTGTLKQEISNFGHPLAVTKAYQYDKFGNIVGQTTTTADLPTRPKFTEYDPSGRFPISETNALGHKILFEYSLLLGTATKVIDPNSVSNENRYDGFGRLIAGIAPTGLKSVDAREFLAGFDVLGRQVAIKQVQTVGTLPEAITYFDYRGRVLRTEKTGKSNGMLRKIFQDTGYDTRGRAVASSLPYFEGEPIYYGKTEYDSLDRPVRSIAPDGGVTETTYAGLLNTMTDANGTLSVKRVNEKGLTVETLDNADGSLKFEYGPGDRLVKTTQVDGLELVHGYDQIGNKILSLDPDLGRWDYEYNGFGEIIWQRDAKGQVTTVSYDLIGRPLRRHMPDKLEQFEYDGTAFGVGKPSAVFSSDGYEEQFTYDNRGRLYRKATRIQGEVFTTSVGYDDYDRVVVTYHPGNYVVSNDYDELGYLSTVSVNDPLKPFAAEHKAYWTAGERDQFGRVISEQLGSGVISTYDYDPLKGNLAHLASQAVDEKQITDISLKYDLIGNLLSKEHKTEKKKEEFSYDKLDRLARWNVNGKTLGLYTYDAAGRILSTTSMGNYSYDGEGPAHAVKRIARPDGTESEYQYDANGNMVSGPKGHFEYYANNSVKLIYKSKDRWSRFSYSSDGTRYLQHYSETRSVGKTKYVANVLQTISVGAYEQIRDLGGPFIVKAGGFQRHRLYLGAEGGVVAVLEHSTEFEPLANDPKFKVGREGSPLAIALTTISASYLHKDELGSILKVTNEEGAVVSGYSYDPWGKKTQVAWVEKGKEDFAEGTFRRGFTGHEHLDNLDLIHMNGRVYDPDLARFVSADPTLQFVGSTQNYDRYAYVGNNPTKYTDPSGFGWLSDAWDSVTGAIGDAFNSVGNWIEKNWRTIVVAVVAVAVTVVSAGTLGPIAAGMLAGAFSSGLQVALYGGSFSDVLSSALRGAVIGGISAGFAAGVGELGLGTYGAAAAHGASQGGLNAMQGGDFWQGFASAAFSSLVASYSEASAAYRQSSLATKAAIGAISGGTGSVIGGGKFENGAITGAFVVVLNHEAHKPAYEEEWYDFLADAPEIPQSVSDFVQGFGSGASFGATDKINNWLGAGNFKNTESAAYMYGDIGGALTTSFYPAAAARGAAYLGKLGQTNTYLKFINSNRYIRFGYTRLREGPFTYGSTYRSGVPGPTMRIGNGNPTKWNHWDLRVLGR
ncbi:hypothetical protein NKH07_24375 [Mesorhizobium sp. M1378]